MNSIRSAIGNATIGARAKNDDVTVGSWSRRRAIVMNSLLKGYTRKVVAAAVSVVAVIAHAAPDHG